jgi:hypothetical protein
MSNPLDPNGPLAQVLAVMLLKSARVGPDAASWLGHDSAHAGFLHECAVRMVLRDFGSLSDHDLAGNERAIKNQEGLVVGAYEIPDSMSAGVHEPALLFVIATSEQGTVVALGSDIKSATKQASSPLAPDPSVN